MSQYEVQVSTGYMQWQFLAAGSEREDAIEYADFEHAETGRRVAVFSNGRLVHVGGDKPLTHARPIAVTYLAGISDEAQRALKGSHRRK